MKENDKKTLENSSAEDISNFSKEHIIESALLKNVTGGKSAAELPCRERCVPACGCGPDICAPWGEFCISSPP
ncbi:MULTISPECIES: hypothetical protein [Pseudoalteromonas]|uniref:Uncharacterized protein n=1 Tax=Pseudoalteromonas arctica TaxID=394751 RepID=A0A7Y0DWA8_9GAMM|nr:hypothetical protein [Pseudoalteromonas arctica]NMM42791.1 hypothetical protein [Pseudoalteromonas arctica]